MTLTGVGPAALAVALVGAGATVGLSLRRRGRLGAWSPLAVAFAGLSVALVALVVALVGNDGSLVYVADHTSRATSWPYRVAGLWGGMAGSLLLWTWMAAGWAVVVGRAVQRRLPELAPVFCGVVAAEVAVLAGLLVFVSRPFDRLAVPAIDGGGLNPVLLHPAMLYHPPLLYAGAVGLVVPFALAVARLATPTMVDDGRWLAPAARAAEVSLVLLGAGLLAGAHWAYVELGWGGYWAWDPVENGGLLPWLAAVAFLHAAVAARRRRDGRPPIAAAALAGLAFCLGLLGAFLTRSGTAQSVHAFAEARAVGRVLAVALAVAVTATAVVVVRARRGRLWVPAVQVVSRAGAITANNLLMVGLVVVIGFGTVFPLLARAVTGGEVVVTGRYFAVVATPLALLLLALLGVGPRLGELRWRLVSAAAAGLVGAAAAGAWLPERRPVAIVMIGLAVSAATLTLAGWWRDRGARWPLAHLGVAVLLAGVAGTTTGAHVTASLVPGQAVTVRGWTLRLDEVLPVAVPGAVDSGRAAEARLVLSRGDHRVATLRPEALLTDTGQRVSVAALRSMPLTDVQVALRAVGGGPGAAVVDVNVLPLVELAWWGGLLIVAGLAIGLRRSPVHPATTVAPTAADVFTQVPTG